MSPVVISSKKVSSMKSSFKRIPRLALLSLALSVFVSACGESDAAIGRPSNLQLTNVRDYDRGRGGFRVVSLHWGEARDASTYQLQRAVPHEERDFEYVKWSHDRNFDDGGYLLGGVFVPGETYVYRVRGFDGVPGPWSEELSVSIPPFLPPEGLSAVYDEERGVVVLEWDAVELEGDAEQGRGLGWEIGLEGPIGGDEVMWFDLTPHPRYEDHPVAPGFDLAYSVRAFHQEYGRTEARTVSIEIPTAPGPVMGEASTGEADSITVSWYRYDGPPSGIEPTYELYRSTGDPEDEDSYMLIGEGHFGQQDGRVVYVDWNVEEGRWYYYRARMKFEDWRRGSLVSFSEMSENHVAGWAGSVEPEGP